MRFRGMTKRYFFNSFVIIVLIFTIIAIILCSFFKNYYYDSVENALVSRANIEVNNNFNEPYETYEEFEEVSREYIYAFPYKENMEVSVINEYGAIMFSSLGYVSSNTDMEDYKEALNNYDKSAVKVITLPTGEKIMALTKLLPVSDSNELPRALRFAVSLDKVDARIFQSYLVVCLICLLIVAAALASSLYFIRSIVNSVRDIESQTALIAQGDFDVRITKKYNDEIGELSDSINDMAVELGKIDKMKYDFISTVSHELRTPLTAIKGWGETLMTIGTSNPELNEKGLSIIVEETTRLSHMVEELLGFSKIQGDHFKMIFKETDLIAELTEAINMFKERAIREEKELIYEVPEFFALSMADGEKIKQVFVNIIDNAIKYTPAGGKIIITAEIDEKFLTVTVEDTGRGISQEDLPHVIEKFYKGANSLSGSSGIGLAVANEIVKQHNGVLKIDSVIDVGTTIYVKIPFNYEESEGL